MPVRFRCACGKALAAKEEFAGRRIRCPECQRVVLIPDAERREPPLALPRRESGRTGSTPVVRRAPTQAKANRSDGDIAAVPNTDSEIDVLRTPTTQYPDAMSTMAAPAWHRHSWIDDSLEQFSLPWLPGDEARFQVGIKLLPEREGLAAWFLPVLVIGVTIWLILAS